MRNYVTCAEACQILKITNTTLHSIQKMVKLKLKNYQYENFYMIMPKYNKIILYK